jgi:hypothetical protein
MQSTRLAALPFLSLAKLGVAAMKEVKLCLARRPLIIARQ